jgi:hypothetical protein
MRFLDGQVREVTAPIPKFLIISKFKMLFDNLINKIRRKRVSSNFRNRFKGKMI